LSASGDLPRSADKNVRAPTRDLNSYETLGYSRTSLRDNDRRPGQGNFRKALTLTPYNCHSATNAPIKGFVARHDGAGGKSLVGVLLGGAPQRAPPRRIMD